MGSLAHFLHKNFLWLVLGSYAAAAFWPGPGLWLRSFSVGTITLFGESTRLPLPVIMLAVLLVNAGLGIETGTLKKLLRGPLPLAAGLAGNLLVPIIFIVAVSLTLQLWHNPDEAQNILLGLALVASMPIAGSSSAWSQKADGDLVLSLGLVVCSTLLSPLTTPVALHSVGLLTTGDYSEDLHELASSGTWLFLGVSVVAPSLLGMAGRAALGESRMASARPWLRLLTCLNLLLLNYSNASLSLPQAVVGQDWDFLAIVFLATTCLCVASFAAGWLIARLLREGEGRSIALTFGLGMNNNGTALVLASTSLAGHPQALLPIIFYNLIQHVVAGVVDFVVFPERLTRLPRTEETKLRILPLCSCVRRFHGCAPTRVATPGACRRDARE
jgi:BASS family bile acid:Na+ symporter